MTRHAGDLGLRAPGKGEASDGRPAQVVKRQALNTGGLARPAPRHSERISSPGALFRIDHNHRSHLRPRRLIERSLKRAANWNDDARTRLRLTQPDALAILGRPRQAQQVALSLTPPQREHHRQLQLLRRTRIECLLVRGRPTRVPRYARPGVGSEPVDIDYPVGSDARAVMGSRRVLADLLTALDQLAPEQRALIALVSVCDLTYTEAAES
jgi:DNA-directed RNA polymerase specialized sigma24 family protein